jgi:DNA-binding PadR family transcriptional regulator
MAPAGFNVEAPTMQMTVNRILTLIAVDILGEKSHGVTVANLIINTTGKHQTLRTGIYPTLHRLRDGGWLDQWVVGDKTPRPFYQLTKAGRKALDDQLAEFEAMGKLWREHKARSKRRAA